MNVDWISLAASRAMNAIVPSDFLPGVTKATEAKKTSPTYGIEGWKNVLQPGMTLPALLGEHRQAPVHCATPYSVIEDDRMVIDDIKIGSTPIKKLMAALDALDDDEEDFNGQSGCAPDHQGPILKRGAGQEYAGAGVMNVDWISLALSAVGAVFGAWIGWAIARRLRGR